jgi:hypothetical protein
MERRGDTPAEAGVEQPVVKEITTLNQFLVGRQTGVDGVVIQNLPCRGLTEEEAINLACWLVAMAGFRAEKRFRELYERIINT